MSKANKISLIILAILAVVLIGSNITLALMTDRMVNTGIIQFKEHKLDISIIGNDSIILSPEELTAGSNAERVITIKNPETSTPCIFRIWFNFYIEGEINNEYLTFDITSGGFTKSESGKYYFDNVLASNANVSNVSLKFSVSGSDVKSYQGKKYNLELFIESIQSNKTAVSEWKEDYDEMWYNKIVHSLS